MTRVENPGWHLRSKASEKNISYQRKEASIEVVITKTLAVTLSEVGRHRRI